MDIRKSIKVSMAVTDINQKELAELTGLTEATISNIINGKNSPSMRTIEKIANAFQISVDGLLGIGNE